MLRTRHVKLRLFIENIELPIDGCTVNTSTRITATVTLLPTKESLDLKSGSNVVVAFKNPDSNPPVVDHTPSEFDHYNILFMGQITSINLDRKTASRSLVLNCTGHDELLSRAYLYYFRVGGDILNQTAQFTGATRLFTESVGRGLDIEKVVHEIAGDEHELHLPGFRGRDEIKGALKIVLGLIERVLGHESAHNKQEKTGAINDYFAVENTLKKLTHQIDAIHTDNYLATYLSDAVAITTLKNTATHLPESDTLYGYATRILREFYYKFTPVGCPYAKQARDAGRLNTYTALESEMLDTIGSHLPQNDALSLTSWFSGTIFSDQQSGYSCDFVMLDGMDADGFSLTGERGVPHFMQNSVFFHWNGANSNTLIQNEPLQFINKDFYELYIKDLPTEILKYAIEQYTRMLDTIFTDRAVTKANAPTHFGTSSQAKEDWNRLIGNRMSWWSSPTYTDAPFFYLVRPVDGISLESNGFVAHVNREVRTFVRGLAKKIFEYTQQVTREDLLQVINYLLLPNLFFATPPTCNVLFPNQISSYNTIEARYSAPTRLMLSVAPKPEQGEDTGDGSTPTTASKSNETLDKRYFAPSSEVFFDIQGTSNTTDFVLLPHERHTGVVPVFRTMNYLTAARAGAVIDKDVDGQNQLCMRIANFELMLRRYEDNRMSVSGPFNPYPVVGLPCAVIDTDDHAGDPTIYIGLIESISHTLASGQTSTSYTLTYVREVDEVDDLFDDASFAHAAGQPSPNNYANSLTNVSSKLIPINLADDSNAVLIDRIVERVAELWLAQSTSMNSLISVQRERDSKVTDDEWLQRIQSRRIFDVIPQNKVQTRAGTITLTCSVPTIKDVVARHLKINPADVIAVDLRLNLSQEKDLKSSLFQWILQNYGSEGDQLLNKYARALKFIDARNRSHLTNPVDSQYAYAFDPSFKFNGTDLTQDTRYPNELIRLLLLGELSYASRLGNNSTEIHVYVKDTSTKVAGGVNYPLAQEEWFRPSWWGDQFSILNIGKQVYDPLVGVQSVNDSAVGIEQDVVSRDSDGTLQRLVSTKKAIVSMYNRYLSSRSRHESFVHEYVKRDLATLTDVMGQHGLFSVRRPIQVSDTHLCEGTKVNTLPTKTKPPKIDYIAVEQERKSRVEQYRTSVRKDAFK